ncbi:E3 ubiquitin-protein ligase RFWD3 isoform X2 [Carica papaya]|uniref:E3 ubiquitin-protein ligase RFWD3 isoform X2 n=1 Tax=Carica papaya TaxID=3649 RepID=UPI000B8CD0AF|nr:E3 ubiquitin-protein ligase RFWD3 isoform X2 [Carica papaya]XP_021892694.1 E3 ubiquitin-protein ligase RFWD3 isoform X2 [Carica papaya]XP_021892695.1 E3 ubiquitin-protein ligase RFWD3 isoform X2 [Carica papaya]XP_021892696.1 E3 ubiquitin-protein ligase RFWD3 isoform X2 [Carica papaya]
MADHHINHMRPVGDDEAQRYANEQDSQEDEEEQQTEEEEMEEDEETEEVELQNEEYIQVVESPWISQDVVEISLENGEGEKQRRDEGGGDVYSSSGSQGSEWSRSEIDGLFCPICMETWTNSGEHHVCCLPCGHIYGFSCIKKWLQQRRTSRKCPQCNRKCTLKDIRKLFASRVTAVDEESQKRIRFLEAKCASLEKENADLCKKEAESRKSTMELQLRVNQLLDRATQLEGSSEEWQCRPSGLVRASWHSSGQSASGNKSHAIFSTEGPSCNFISQEELRVDGARLFDVDASGQIILLTRKLSRDGGTYVITKMSLISPHETQDILLLPGTRPIKDLHISPSSSGLALFASMGKKLSVISMESNNIVLSYHLPVPAWSCSWDLNNSHHIYAGLQNGSLWVFDMRQTTGAMESLNGLSSNPIHTVHPLLQNSALSAGSRVVLSASSLGLCQWNFGGANERAFLVPETKNQGVCTSFAYCRSSDDIVASYRPRVEFPNEITFSQPSLTPSPVMRNWVQGSHIHIRRDSSGSCYQKLGSACSNVDSIRLPRTIIIDRGNEKQLFGSWDESACELMLRDLPSFSVVQRFKAINYPIHDVRYTHVLHKGLLGLLSENTLQLFSSPVS